MTESALLAIKPSKLESQLRTSSPAAVLDVEMDAMVDTHLEPGTISKKQALLLDGFTTHQTGAHLTISLHAITTPQENMNHVVLQNQPQLAKNLALKDIQVLMKLTNGRQIQFIQFHHQLKKFKLKS